MKGRQYDVKVALLLVLAIWLVGCGPPAQEVAFSSLYQDSIFLVKMPIEDDLLVGGEVKLITQDFFLVTSTTEAYQTSTAFWDDPNEPMMLYPLRDYDFSESFVIVAYYGFFGTSNYYIEVERVTTQGQAVEVIIRAWFDCDELRPDQICSLRNITSTPGHIISINYADLPTTGVLTFNFRVNGELVKIIERELPPPAGE